MEDNGNENPTNRQTDVRARKCGTCGCCMGSFLGSGVLIACVITLNERQNTSTVTVVLFMVAMVCFGIAAGSCVMLLRVQPTRKPRTPRLANGLESGGDENIILDVLTQGREPQFTRNSILNNHCRNSLDIQDSASLPDESDISDLPPPPPYSVATLGMGMHGPDAPMHSSSGHTPLTTQDGSTMYSSPPSYQEIMEKETLHNSEAKSLDATGS